MIVGNVGALMQTNVKRMLGYSSIGHAGYLLLGVVAGGLGVASAKPAVLFYLVTYTFTTLGAFGVVAWIGNRKDERLFVDDWAGVAAERQGVALAMTIFLLSLGGVPPTGGFFGKFYLFKAAMESPQLYWLVVVAVLNSVVSVYYYLRVVVAMYMQPEAETAGASEAESRRGLALFAASACAAGVLLLGILPGWLLDRL
jgi:NADH-quinone oxidoreductase subunit N